MGFKVLIFKDIGFVSCIMDLKEDSNEHCLVGGSSDELQSHVTPTKCIPIGPTAKNVAPCSGQMALRLCVKSNKLKIMLNNGPFECDTVTQSLERPGISIHHHLFFFNYYYSWSFLLRPVLNRLCGWLQTEALTEYSCEGDEAITYNYTSEEAYYVLAISVTPFKHSTSLWYHC